MVSAIRAVFAGLCFSAMLAPVTALAQQPPPPPPFPGDAPGTPVLPQTIAVPQLGQPVPPPQVWQPIAPVAPPAPLVPPPPLAQGPNGEPLIFRPPQNTGWFAAFELSVVAPSIGGHQSAPVNFGGVSTPVSLPFADLDWTGSPRLEFGYRFGELGSVVAAYRSVVSQGGRNVDDLDPLGMAFVKTRLNVNIIDFMYVSPDIPLTKLWDLKWDAGLRIGAVYYDSQATGQVLTQQVTNNFVGVGPRAGLGVRRYLEGAPGISLFGLLEAGVMLGQDSQSYERSLLVGNNTVINGGSRIHSTPGAPMLDFQVGLSYSPPQNARWLRFSGGYEFEEWWGVGSAGGNSGNVQFQGLFFRAEFHY